MKNLMKALGMFQSECPDIHKATEGYGYKYAELPQILKIVNPILLKHSLSIAQVGQGKAIKTILTHFDSGEQIESCIDIPQSVSLKGMNDFQVLGSAISYLRRYSIEMILGISSTKDNDAHGEQEVKKQNTQHQPEQPQKPWLNMLDKAGKYTDVGKQAFDSVLNGTLISAIEKKYALSKTTRAELEKAAALFNSNNPQ